MQSKSIIEERIIHNINAAIGNDFNKIHCASTLVEGYRNRLALLKENLNYNENSSLSNNFSMAFSSQQHACDSIDFQTEKLQQFGEKLQERIKISTQALGKVDNELMNIQKLQQLIQYLEILREIQELSFLLSKSIDKHDYAKLIQLYLKLYEEHDTEYSILGKLCNVEAPFLKTFATATANYWYSLLKNNLVTEFELMLKSMKWGERDQDAIHIKQTNDQIIKIQKLAEYLFLLKSPTKETEQLAAITPNIICQPFSIVTKLLVAPYRQRFLYHFTGVKQTNRLDKPEWFYTQILNWAKETFIWVDETFQISANKAGLTDFNVKLEFLRGFVQLTIEKIAEDIIEISHNEGLFAHLIDETLAFDAELKQHFNYPASFPSAVGVITQPIYLMQWISLEQKFCSERMDRILQSNNAWELIDPNWISDDDLKIPKCSDQFIRLLEAIKDRYHGLVQPGHQLQFLNLQLELIDNFRRRLVQLHSSGIVESVPILNAINYIKMVLSEWGENVHYLHLNATLMQTQDTTENEDVTTTFEKSILELEHWSKQLLKNLSIKVVNEVKAKSMSYRHDQWPSIPNRIVQEPFVLSSSAAEMFQTMVTILHNLERDLSSNLFNIILRLIAQQIDDYFLDNMIMNTKFSSGGAAQFHYDITRNLFPLFGQYNRRADLLFKKTHDAVKLLNANHGTALLLYETLKSNDAQLEEKMSALKELGVINFKLKTCMEVLERRIDIKKF